ncbi:peroxin [Rhizophlyctis rosea]|uniref:Peroxin n=1 Tax=Rhizophlyctis rosea TaxID=64517 RepID=A0AAD5S6H8_9FUNG|nr:peroxin [Rhizophlyctis rosea]
MHDCSFAVSSLLPTLSENLFADLDVERVTSKLQQNRTAKTNEAGEPIDDKQRSEQKIALWEELKILGFTRTISSIYLLTLLILFTHLQLNLLGRFFYLDSVHTFADQLDLSHSSSESSPTEPRVKAVSDETERKYLTFSWYILNVGWKRCVEKVREAVREVIGSMSLKEPLSFQKLEELITEIRTKVDTTSILETSSQTAYPFVDCLMPPEGNEAEVIQGGGATLSDGVTITEESEECTTAASGSTVEGELQDLLNETRDFLESPDFQNLLSHSLTQSFSLLLSQLRPTFEITPKSPVLPPSPTSVQPEESSITELPTPEMKDVPLAGVIPVFSRMGYGVLAGVGNGYLEALADLPELKAFAVVVYTGWEDGGL